MSEGSMIEGGWFTEIQMVCGSRGFIDKAQVRRWADTLHEKTILIHGGCPNSPDVWAATRHRENGGIVGEFPFALNRHKYGGLYRNALVEMAHRIVAFWDGHSNGTKYVIAYATKLGKPIEVRGPMITNVAARP